jgi:Homing endonuclease associated repeat
MSRDEVIAVIKKAAEELGHVPSMGELKKSGKLPLHAIRKNFGHYVTALEACGLERTGHGYKVSTGALFLDWIRLVRQLRKVPSLVEYEAMGKYSTGPYAKRFGGWLQVAPGLMRFALDQKLEAEWNPELEIVKAYLEDAPKETRNASWKSRPRLKPQLRLDEPIYGPPMADTHLLLEPTNEQSVIFLFGAMARKLGFAVIQIQTGYPDCEALREVEPGRWQRVRIEFEYESRNFLSHLHAPEKCDLIVCWSHNWPDCPLEVLELKSAGKNLTTDEHG